MKSCHVCGRYAWECQTQEGGWGLDGVLREQAWKLRGIVNGIDTSDWSPQVDSHLASDGYTNYDAASLVEGKARCKQALQRVRTSAHSGQPGHASVSSLAQQAAAAPWLSAGPGASRPCSRCVGAQTAHPGISLCHA